MDCKLPQGNIPVIGEADAAVIGGSFAGISAAIRMAEAGKRVFMIEPRTYLGWELTATLRPWLAVGREAGAERERLPELIRTCLELCGAEMDGSNEGSVSVPLHPDRLKRCLEDLLEAKRIQLLYASLPIALSELNGKLAGVVIANKSGRQAVRCDLLVDATETALCAQLCSEKVIDYRYGPTALYYRTLEFTGVGEHAEVLQVPAELGLAGNMVRLRRGYRGNGHVLAEFGLVLASANRLDESRSRETEARRRGMRLAVYLTQQAAGFGKAVLAAASHELLGPFPPASLETGFSLDASPIHSASTVRSDAIEDHAAAALSGVWSLFKEVYVQGGTGLLNAVQAARIGEVVAERMLGADGAGAEDESASAARRDSAPNPKHSAEDRAYDSEPCRGLTLHAVQSSADGEASREGEKDLSGNADADADVTQYTVRIPSLVNSEKTPFSVAETRVPVLRRVDVLVAGGGSSGANAAITAAREGMRTALVDLNPGLGGTGTFGGVDSYWFGRRIGPAARIEQNVADIQKSINYKGHKWNIEAKMFALLQDAESAGADLLLNAMSFGAVMQDSKVCGAVIATRWGAYAVLSEATIDATGDGDLAAFAGADYVYGSEKDHTVMWYSLAQFTEPSKIQNNFTSMVDVSNVLDYTRAILAGRRRGQDCHDHGIYVATRESRHIQGDALMRLSDQLLHRRWPDVVNIHFSNHDVKGVSGADWVNVGLIPPNLEIEIPYRMLLPKGLEGLLVAGKAISATHDALPAIRMQSDLENLGAVTALAAAQAVRTGKLPREIELSALQENLVRIGLLPENVLTRKLEPIHYGADDLERLVESIEADEPLYEYSNMRMNEIYRSPIPFVEISSAGKRIIPYLKKALERAEGMRKIRLAQALAMLESPAGVPVLVEEIMKQLSGTELPPRTAEIMYVQLPPDHGAMPDAAYLLYSLAQAKDKRSLPVWRRVAELLHPAEEDFKDTWKGIYYYVDAVCQGAERLADEEAVSILEQMHRVPFLNGQQCLSGAQPDYFLERRAMLELALGRALARSGSAGGYKILIGYTADVRSLLAKQALLELRRLTGLSFGSDMKAWETWLAEHIDELRPAPLDLKLDVEADSESLLRHVR